jgi:hypothetical protein
MAHFRAKHAWTLSLYAYDSEAPSAELYAMFYDRLRSLCAKRDAPLTDVLIEGPGLPQEWIESESRVAQRLVARRFAGVTELRVATQRHGHDVVAGYGSLVRAGLRWRRQGHVIEVELQMEMNEAVLEFASQGFVDLLRDLLSWRKWSTGFADRDTWGRLGQRTREVRATGVWLEATLAQRQRTARGIYAMLALNHQQLSQQVTRSASLIDRLRGRRVQSGTLADYIAAAQGTRSERVGELTLWWIPEERLERIRADLRGTAAVMPEKLPWGDEARQAQAARTTAPSPPVSPPPEPPQSNPARDALWELIRAQVTQAPEELPIVPFELFFEGNDEEDSIAPNQAGYGRPSLAAMYATLKEIADRPDVQAVLVSMHEDTLHWLERGETYGWPEAEYVHILTSASQEEVERWVEEFDSDGVTADWAYSTHPAAPLPQRGYRAYTVSWD